MARGKLMLSTANIVTLLAIGACYVLILQFVLMLLASHFPQVMSSAGKMMLTGTSAAIAITAVFIFNRFVTRQNMLWLGLVCGLMAFTYFYIIKSWPNLFTAISVMFYSYSLFALLAFTVAPVLVGVIWHRARRLSGFHLLLSQGR